VVAVDVLVEVDVVDEVDVLVEVNDVELDAAAEDGGDASSSDEHAASRATIVSAPSDPRRSTA